MVIQRMNNVLVKHSKVLFSVITAVIIVSFVWFFTPGVDGSLLFNGGGNNAVYGKFFDQPIRVGTVRDGMDSLRLAYAAINGVSPHQISSLGEEEAFQLALMEEAAKKFGVSVSDEELAEFVREIVFFQKDGVFSDEAYLRYGEEVLKPAGYTLGDLEKSLKTLILNGKVMAFGAQNVVLTDDELDTGVARKLEKRKGRVIAFEEAAFLPGLNPEVDEVRGFYNANLGEFMSEPVSDTVFAAVFFEDFPASISEEEVKKHYEATLESYKDKDGKTQPLDAVSKAIRMDLEGAQRKLAASTKMSAFNSALRETSRSPEYVAAPEAQFRAAAEKAGLKLVEAKGLVPSSEASSDLKTEQSLIQAVTSLKNVHSTTNVVSGKNGSYVAMLTGRIAPKQRTFEEAAGAASAKLKRTKARVMMMEAARNLQLKLKESKNPANDLEQLVAGAHGKVTPLPEFSRMVIEMLAARGFTPLELNLSLVTKPGELSPPVEQGASAVLVFVDELVPPSDDEKKNSRLLLSEQLLQEKKQRAAGEFVSWIFQNSSVNRSARGGASAD